MPLPSSTDLGGASISGLLWSTGIPLHGEPICLWAQVSGMVAVNSDTSFTVTYFNYDGQVLPYTALCVERHLLMQWSCLLLKCSHLRLPLRHLGRGAAWVTS